MIPTEQNSKKDSENPTHVTEICQYPIKIFFLQQFNMYIVNDAA